MVRKYRKGIDLDVVAPALASIELEMELLFGTMRAAQEAAA